MSLPIGFFAPLPLPMMIPFMGMQSAVMAEQFGTLFQYGKRRISAMSNEEFNALTPEILQIRMTEQLQKMIPEMEKQIQAMSPLVSVIIREFANYIKLAITTVTSSQSGFTSTSGSILPSQPSPTGSSYVQGTDGKTYYYENGILISVDGVPVNGTTTPTTTTTTTTPEPTEARTIEIEIDRNWDAYWDGFFNVKRNDKYGGDSSSYNNLMSSSITRIYQLQEEYNTLTGHYYQTNKDTMPVGLLDNI